MHIPDQLAVLAPCPVLILPYADTVPRPFRRMLVAWKPTREASRALRDALPLLLQAEEVVVLTVGDDDADARQTADVEQFLKRHGIAARFTSSTNGDRDAGRTVLAVTHDMSCDTVVMGAYGHSRLRELVMGGVTRWMMSNMDLPVLVLTSH